jgi:hypothetical protein
MFQSALFEALTRSGTLQRAFDDAIRQARRDNRMDDANLYFHARNQIADARANPQ